MSQQPKLSEKMSEFLFENILLYVLPGNPCKPGTVGLRSGISEPKTQGGEEIALATDNFGTICEIRKS